MREQPLFDMPQTSTDPNFWRKEQELVMKELCEKLSAANAVYVQKVLNLTALSTKPYFQEAVWIVRKLGLEPLMVTQQNYSIKFVQQFFAIVQFGSDEDVKLTWMTGPIKCESSMTRFRELLGYVFRCGEESQGIVMHVEGCTMRSAKWLLFTSTRPPWVRTRISLPRSTYSSAYLVTTLPLKPGMWILFEVV